MGLFDKKTCSICGASVGLLGGLVGESLAGDAYMCGDCRKKCIPSDKLDFKAMTVDDAKALLAVAEANRKKGAAEFHATRQFVAGAYGDRPALDVDEGHGWFMNAATKDGWVYDLDDIYTFCLDATTIPLAEGETYSLNLHPYPELPTCPNNQKVIDLKLKIWLLDNELGVDMIAINLIPAFAPDETQVQSAYACAQDFYSFMKSWRMAQKQRRGVR